MEEVPSNTGYSLIASAGPVCRNSQNDNLSLFVVFWCDSQLSA